MLKKNSGYPNPSNNVKISFSGADAAAVWSQSILKKKQCITMATTTATIAAGLKLKGGVMGVVRFQMLVSSLPLCRTTAYTHSISNSIWKKSSSDNENENEKDVKDDIKDAGNVLDIRVARIIKAWRHEEADSLYVQEVDVGEPEPRIICSGLVSYIPLHLLQDAQVVVLANLKPRNMRGVQSCGMLMTASDESHDNVELLVPPEGSLPGDRLWFGTQDDQEKLSAPAKPNQIQKKKIWESVQPHLKTDASCIAMLGGHLMRTPAGVVTSKSLKNANIS